MNYFLQLFYICVILFMISNNRMIIMYEAAILIYIV